MPHLHITGLVIPKQHAVKLTGVLKTNDILVGELCAFESGFLVPATVFTWDTDEATTQLAFAAAFAGVSSGASDKDLPLDTRDHRILMTQDGECELDVESATYTVGQFLAPKKNAATNFLTNVLKVTAVRNAAIFIVSESSVGAATRVRGYMAKTLPKRADTV